MSQLKIFLKTN